MKAVKRGPWQQKSWPEKRELQLNLKPVVKVMCLCFLLFQVNLSPVLLFNKSRQGKINGSDNFPSRKTASIDRFPTCWNISACLCNNGPTFHLLVKMYPHNLLIFYFVVKVGGKAMVVLVASLSMERLNVPVTIWQTLLCSLQNSRTLARSESTYPPEVSGWK